MIYNVLVKSKHSLKREHAMKEVSDQQFVGITPVTEPLPADHTKRGTTLRVVLQND